MPGVTVSSTYLTSDLFPDFVLFLYFQSHSHNVASHCLHCILPDQSECILFL